MRTAAAVLLSLALGEVTAEIADRFRRLRWDLPAPGQGASNRAARETVAYLAGWTRNPM